jgi:hypothetical protein
MNNNDENKSIDLAVEAPLLCAIPRDYFRVPEGYFADLESSINREFREGTSELSVPDGYFENMHDEILKSIENTKDEAKVIPISRSRNRYWITVALSAAATGLLLFWMLGMKEEKCETFACLLDQTELSNEDLMILDETEIVELLGDDYDMIDATEMNDSELDAYLEDDIENISIDELYE